MENNSPDMAGRVNHPDNHQEEARPVGSQPDWSDLVARLVDSISRLIRVEINFLEGRVKRTVASTVSSAAIRIVAIVLLAITGWLGLICLLVSYVLLLHQWLLWWQSVGAAGVTVIVLGLAIFAILSVSARRTRSG
jgi:hypothetical protein